ncbi:MAG: glycerol kinase GlpK [Dysgonamonadaceae bacterium]|jgi:glycerol kinase|nr:glycerol kinase GlpK [Dysgonamonadaceae bacterium]
MQYTIAIDQSTSATKALLFAADARLVHHTAVGHRQYYPQPGWVEHDPEEILQNTRTAIRRLLDESGVASSAIQSLAITNQRETVVAWNKTTGKPVYNAVVWQCNRGASRCEQLIAQGHAALIREKTGLIINPYFSASGLQWILDNVNEAIRCATKDNLLIGTMDTWLIWHLTGGKVHATDYTNASRTLLFNIHTLDWDDELLALFSIRRSMLPQVLPCDAVFGTTSVYGLLPEVPIAGVMGDSHGALAGQCCFQPGMGKVTYGTGSSIMVNIGEKALPAPGGLVTSVGFSATGKTWYAFEGNIHCTGATIQWLAEEAGLIASADESEPLAVSVCDNGGVYLVPAFAGLGAPWWDADARALLCGMSRGTTKAHIVRAALESIAYQIKDLMDLITAESGIVLKALRVDGGPVKNRFLMQFQAGMLQTPIHRSAVEEASALGAIVMNRLALNQLDSLETIACQRKNDETILPAMSPEQAESLYRGWRKAVERTLLK